MGSVKRAFRVAISGSYGGLNLGDEAILNGIVAQLRKSLAVEITVFTRDPEDTQQRHRVERAIQIRELTRDEAREQVKRCEHWRPGDEENRGRLSVDRG